jgi:hypothetical protein
MNSMMQLFYLADVTPVSLKTQAHWQGIMLNGMAGTPI